MPSPQLENGYVKIATEIMEALIKYRIPGEQMQCLLFIIRKTYGWNKKEDEISLYQFMEATGLVKPSVCRAINNLKSKNVIFVNKKANRTNSTYCFNKKHTEWKPLTKKLMPDLPGRISINEIKAKIRKRDNNTCMLCGVVGDPWGNLFPVHHIDFNQTNNKDNNLITLCKTCHGKSHTVVMKEKLSKKIISISKKANQRLQKSKSPLTKKLISTLYTKDTTKDTNNNYTKDFLVFYIQYPLKKSKGAAFKSWQKLKRENQLPNLETLIEAIKQQEKEKEVKCNAGTFCPEWKHPATWLNQKCWEDEVDFNVKTKNLYELSFNGA